MAAFRCRTEPPRKGKEIQIDLKSDVVAAVPPLPRRHCALFLDFDGTLVPFAPSPDAICVPGFLAPLMDSLARRLNGAVAVVTGRSIDNLRSHLGATGIAAAGEHGAELRLADGTRRTLEAASFADELAAAQTRFTPESGVLVERKSAGFAVHYRRAPDMAARVRAFMNGLADGRADLDLIDGKFVLELRSRHIDKGLAIIQLMRMEPFAGRRPYFLGDDTTDEDGFRAVNALNGISVKVGAGESCARAHLPEIDAVHRWLQAAEENLAETEG